jgi:hypothetical protein
MPSRAKARAAIEAAFRALSFIVLALMLWQSLDVGRPERIVSGRSANLDKTLRDWSSSGLAPDRAFLELDRTPTPAHRDWIRALSRAGTDVTWHGNLPAAAVSVEPIRSPRGGFTVLAAAPSDNRVSIEDDLGLIEGTNAAAGGTRFFVPSASGDIIAKAGGTTARASLPDSVRVGRVLVVGSANWETKFVTAALEEDGWKVDADIRVAPGASVTQGTFSQIDTARYSAVVALDGSAASRASDIERYAALGGGVVLAGTTGSLEAFASIRAGTAGRIQSPSATEGEPGSVTAASLSFSPIASLRADAIALESENGFVISAARRHVAGRILQLGYIDTWRWRMSGGADSPAEHRQEWTRAVASVAYAPVIGRSATATDDAPVAGLVGAVGPSAQRQGPTLASSAGSISLWLLFAILSLSLLAEWASRRMRGSR